VNAAATKDETADPSERSTEYRIVVRGRLDASWSGRLGGMSLTRADQDVEGAVSTLHGRLQDQEELSGILDTLYELHLPILSVKKLDDEE
jgi:hypothetical protein